MLKKYISKNLTTKLFLIICSILIGVSLLICVFFSFLMPASYISIINDEYFEELETMILNNENNALEPIKEELQSISTKYGIYIELSDVSERILESFGDDTLKGNQENELRLVVDPSEYPTEGEGYAVYSGQASEDSVFKLMINNEEYTISAFGQNADIVNEVTLVLKEIIPIVLIMMIIISLIIANVFSRYIAKPIKVVNENVRKIAQLDFSGKLDEKRVDELGELSRNINFVSVTLDNTLLSLREELRKEKEREEGQRLFFAAASHELKTPLTVVKGNLEGMIYGYKQYEDREIYLPKTLRAATQMELLINEILTISSMGSEDYKLQIETFSFTEMIRELLIENKELLEMKQLKLSLDLEELEIDGDEKLLKKALQNIISNAIHYSPEDESISVILKEDKLVIENTGVTIPEEELNSIFEPFHRIEKSRNRQTGGSGLGLYFVKIILLKHGFSYQIANKGNGVQFRITTKI